MAKLKYDGPFDAVDIPDLGIENVQKGSTFDVPDDAVAALAIQTELFTPADKRAKDILADYLKSTEADDEAIEHPNAIDDEPTEPNQEG